MRRIERFVHALKLRKTPLHTLRGILHKNIEKVAVSIGMYKMSVILHPAHRAILSDNPVFHIVKILTAVRNLCSDTLLHLVDVLRMDKPLKRVARQRLELLQRIAAEDPQHGAVYINQLLDPVRVINKKTAGHSLRNLLDNGQRLLVKADR